MTLININNTTPLGSITVISFHIEIWEYSENIFQVLTLYKNILYTMYNTDSNKFPLYQSHFMYGKNLFEK